MPEDGLQPLDRIYRLGENTEWRHLLDHLRLLDGFGLILVLAPEQAGADVCRRTLERHFAEEKRTVHFVQLQLAQPPGTLGDLLLHGQVPGDAAAIWVSAPESESVLHDEALRQLWHDALAALNPRRNPLRRQVRVPLILAGPMWLQDVCREAAPDLWSVRDTIARIEPVNRELPAPQFPDFGGETLDGDIENETGDPAETRHALDRLRKKTVPSSQITEHSLLKARLLHRLGRQLWKRHEWDAAERALLEAEEIVEQRHQCLDEQGRLLFELARFLHARGDYSRFEHYARKAYEFTNAHFGPQDRKTLASRNSLANALAIHGRHSAAEQEHRAVLQVRERVVGAEHPDTLKSRNNLANALNAQGRHAAAEQEHRAVLQVRERVLGAEHPDTLVSRYNLANVLRAQGKHAEAEREHQSVLKIEERILGAEHPDVAQSCYNLALCLEDQKKLPEALAFMHRAEQGYTKALGPDHPYPKDAKAGRERIEAALAGK